MPNKTKEKIKGTIKNIENNFQRLLENKDVKKVVNDMKKFKSKRTKVIDKMLTDSWTDIKKSYNREEKAMKQFFENEKNKINSVFKSQLDELRKMKSTLEEHVATARGKKVTKKTTKKKVAKKATKKATKKVAKKATKKAAKRTTQRQVSASAK